MKSGEYRPDIDGLRALAVIPVVLYHADITSFKGIPFATGGFVGVDIFFVISGYLISRILYADISSNTYSVMDFYARRARRIFPALFAIYFACLTIVTINGVFNDTQQIRDTVLYSIFFASNIYFANNSGYFETDTQNNPLLHTWSLSIEEQFYILLPAIFLCLRRISKQWHFPVLATGTLASLAASFFITKSSPDAAYYNLSTRAWELGIGSLLGIFHRPIQSSKTNNMLGLAGIACIIFSTSQYSKYTEFPGIAALVPTLGAAALIASGSSSSSNTITARLLGTMPFRWIGKISYSMYLWHWPILVFARTNGFTEKKHALIAIGICTLISYLSWRHIEQPFRLGNRATSPRRVVGAGLTCMGLTSCFALASVPVNATLLPTTAQALKFASFDKTPSTSAMREGICFLTSKFNDLSYFDIDRCLTEPSTQPKRILVIGDSHAAHLYDAIRSTNPTNGVLQATASGCLPTAELTGEKRCIALLNFILKEFLPFNRMDVILISGRWTADSAEKSFTLAKTLLGYANNVIVVGPNIEYSRPLPKLLGEASIKNAPRLPKNFEVKSRRTVDEKFKTYAKRYPGVTYISFFDAMCASDACPLASSTGDPFLYDDNHFSIVAAVDFAKRSGLGK